MSIRFSSVRRGGLLTILVALLALLLPTGSAAAAASNLPTTYMGVFSGDVLFVPLDGVKASQCDTTKFPDLSGTWRVTLRDGKAPVVTVAMFSEGKLHVAYGGKAFGMPWSDATVTGQVFRVVQPAMAPAEFSLTLVGDQLTYYIAPYNVDAFDQHCASATITGTLTRTAS